MTKQNPTDRQLVNWWMYEAMRGRHDLHPTWVSVQFAVNGAFKVEIREKRATHLTDLIRNEVVRLQVIYAKRAHALL